MKPKLGQITHVLAFSATPLEPSNGNHLDAATSRFADEDGDLVTASVMSTRALLVHYPPQDYSGMVAGRLHDEAGITVLVHPEMSWVDILRCLGKLATQIAKHRSRMLEIFEEKAGVQSESRLWGRKIGFVNELDAELLAGALLLHEDVRPPSMRDCAARLAAIRENRLNLNAPPARAQEVA